MALAGLKKQINKANQYVSEKMGTVEGTKLTEEYHELEKKTDATAELVDELINKTKEYLQPNPATRAKMMIGTKVATTRAHAYTQPEGNLGEAMLKSSKKLGETTFAISLNEMGEALKEMAEIKYALEDNVKQNFLEPLVHLQTKDIRDVMHHRRKLESRRLDFDGKRRKTKAGHVPHEEIKLAEDKFEESFNLASVGMFNLLQNEAEQISQLAALSEALYEYHSQCANILESLTSRLMEQKKIAAEKSPEEYVPKKLEDLQLPHVDEGLNLETGGHSNGAVNSKSYKINNTTTHLFNARTPVNRGPCCQALYDFDAENPRELAFKEGDIIQLLQKLDDNWFEGTVNNKTGIFPINYVQVLVPLGQ